MQRLQLSSKEGENGTISTERVLHSCDTAILHLQDIAFIGYCIYEILHIEYCIHGILSLQDGP